MIRRFRFRLFALVVLIALVTTGATAWLTARAISSQWDESADVQKQTQDLISSAITDYGRTHATWEGVDRLVGQLQQRTGQRIRLTALDGTVVVDTDTLSGRTARALSNRSAILINPVPQPPDPPVAAFSSIGLERSGMRTAACLTRRGAQFTTSVLPDGRWTFAAVDESMVKGCVLNAADSKAERNDDQQAWRTCMKASPSPLLGGNPACLRAVFADRLTPVAAVPLQLGLGYGMDRMTTNLSYRRVLAAAGLVAALVIAGTLLLTRRVMASVEELSRGAQRLAAGDLTWRARVRGDDEIARLTAAFNRMAFSLERGEVRQRRMINDVAHELRTPLANIRGYLEALRDGVLEPDHDLFRSLHEESVFQQRLIDDLQELAVAEAGGMLLRPVRLGAAEFLATCQTAHLAVAESQGVRLVVDADPEATVTGDPDRLRQALGNLVTNALKATPPGGTVTLSAAVEDGVELAVRDTGHGIDADGLDHVFDRFWRADLSRSRDTGGRGLGLAITREIVLAHHGTITARSEPGSGSVFTISLPVG